jgi:hypothetical protein
MYAALNDADVNWSGLVDDALQHLVPWWFLGLSPNYAELPGQGPFFGLDAVLSETVPGLRLRPKVGSWILPPPIAGFHVYNAAFPTGIGSGGAIEWSSSWNNWGGPPVDTINRWSVTLRSTDSKVHRADVTPRRTQNFQVVPGSIYSWSLYNRIGQRVGCGCLVADASGTITVPRVRIGARGRKLVIERGSDPTCLDCVIQVGPVPGSDDDAGSISLGF